MHKKLTMWWFLWGLGSQFQIIASLSLTELVVLVVAPFALMRDWRYMKQDGIIRFWFLAFTVVIGCVISCMYNGTPFYAALRGYAATIIILAAIPVVHLMLRSDPDGFKWSVLSGALSTFLCAFFFKQAVEVASATGYADGKVSAAELMEGPIFWIGRLAAFAYILPVGWYLQTPYLYSVCAPLFMAGFSLLTTASGRAAASSAIGTVVLCLLGGKTRRSIARVCKNFWGLLIIGALGLFLVNVSYRYVAVHGLLGEAGQEKYEKQTRAGKSVLHLLMGGRSEVFVGLTACLDKPIIGFGPWARDENGYYENYLIKYGDIEDYELYYRTQLDFARMGAGSRIRLIPAHSHIIASWLWYGIMGLFFWLYVIYVLLRYLKQDCAAVPQWYYWIACMMPGTFWNIFFSPMPNRLSIPMIVVACLMARLVRQGRFYLPIEMERKISNVR